MSRRLGLALVVTGAFAYFVGFAADVLVEYEDANESTQRLLEISWDLFLLLPLLAVGAAALLWPRWGLVLSIAAVFLVVPLGVYQLEIATGAERPLRDSCDPCIDTRFLSVLAAPALVLGGLGIGVTRWRRRSRTK